MFEGGRMEELTELCFRADAFYFELFKRYEKQLELERPQMGFLAEDCYTPSGQKECYPILAGVLEALLPVMQAIKKTFLAETHEYLRTFYAIIQQLKNYLPRRKMQKM